MAEREGFEPSKDLKSLHDFQSCALDQLSHLSIPYSVSSHSCSQLHYYISEKRICQQIFCGNFNFFQKNRRLLDVAAESCYNESRKIQWERMNFMGNAVEPLWKDRKRHFGLPLSFTKYSMSDDRLFVETGFLNLHMEEILLYRVRDICLHLSLGQRIFGVGSVVIQTSDKTAPTIELKNIKNPREVKEQIHRQVEAMNIPRRMRFGEILDGDGNPGEDDDDLLGHE